MRKRLISPASLGPALVGLALLLAIGLNTLVVASRGGMLNSDFFGLWAGGRAVLLGLNPYEPGIWADLHAQSGSAWLEPFFYPPFTALVFAPVSLLPVRLAAVAWLTLSEAMVVAALFLAQRGLNWHSRPEDRLVLALGVILFRPVILMLVYGQLSALLLFVVSAAFYALRRDRLFLAGALLGLLIIKPQIAGIVLPLALAWLATGRRGWAVAGLFTTGAVGLAASWLIRPDWLESWRGLVSMKMTSISPFTPTAWGLVASVLRGTTLAGYAPLITLVALAVFAVPVLTWAWRTPDDRSPALGLSAALALALVATPYVWNYDQLLLLFPWVVGLSLGDRIGGWPKLALSLLGLVCLGVAPLLLAGIAAVRNEDTFSALVPVLALAFLAVSVSLQRSAIAGRFETSHGDARSIDV